MKVLLIDNYDSFTYNLYQYLIELGASIKVIRNDKIDESTIKKIKPDKIVISPGPGRPENAGNSCKIIESFYKKIPILGVCLGHQCIGYVFGGKIVNAKRIMHGKTSKIKHNGSYIFKEIENPFVATRYHSLVISKEKFPSELEITALSDDGEIMGVKHKKYKLFGVQFHPESILTNSGKKLLENFLKI
ncbi:MAG: aminodeoxychorismate/anthranilate synthase component II [bacterium]|nr:aminodeoxychorismate/anthranilate synthase component II [bacterium]